MYEDEPNSTLLRSALKTNAVVSALTGVAIAAGAGIVGPLIGFDLPLLYQVIGAGLAAFAAWVWFVGTRNAVSQRDARIVLWLDVLWVLGSTLLLLGFSQLFTIVGIVLIAGAAAMVAAFATAEYAGIRRISAPS